MDPNVPIAVIGMACRFAGDVTSPEKLWDICAEGRSAWTEIPKSRFNLNGVYHPNQAKQETLNVKGGHFLTEDPALFDANFFNLSAEVAASIDPQFRLQLESTYEAFESAGLTLQDVAGSNTAVYAGAFFRDYIESHMRDPETLPKYLLMGIGAAMASNRISHFFDLKGPSMTIDTGCSTTLTAFHQACQALRTKESDMSIVGGANVTFNPDMFVVMSSLTLLSPEGKSFAFDSRASGYGRGEGSATVVLKRLDDALRDGDPIRAVVRETGVNQDGRTETITTPSGVAQESLIRACYRKAGLDPAHTTYFEAHGTGTPTGDPIEAGAIASVFKDTRTSDRPLRLGSVKTNIGHTETASGLASIIKVVMALEKHQIPPSINFDKPNPKLDLVDWNMQIPTKLEPWVPVHGIRRASVNNFGYGGANAHVIIEDLSSYLASKQLTDGHGNDHVNGKVNGRVNGHSNKTNGVHFTNGVDGATGTNGTNGTNGSNDAHVPNGTNGANGTNGHLNGHSNDEDTNLSANKPVTLKPQDPPSRVFIISAKDERATQAMTSDLQVYLGRKRESKEAHDDEDKLLGQLAYTLSQRRTRFPWTSVVAAASLGGLVNALASPKARPVRHDPATNTTPRLGFVFTGQGAQWWAMGRELIAAYPVFRLSLEESERMLKDLGSSWMLTEELTRSTETSRVTEQYLSMPACVALQVALVELLASWNIKPSAITSHSSGEIAASYAAGALDKRSAIAVGYARGQFVANAGGGMMAVGLGIDACNEYLARVSSGQLVAACMNSPSSTTVSGDVSGLDELEALLKDDDIFARRLRVDAAYHSHHMQPFSEPYQAWIAEKTDLGCPKPLSKEIVHASNLDTVFFSPTTGGRVTDARVLCDPVHWAKSLVNPVRFVEAFQGMMTAECDERAVDMVLEVGPHGALGGPIAEILGLPELAEHKVPYATCLVRNTSAVDTMHTVVGDLLRRGYGVDLDAVNFPTGRQAVKVLHDLPHYPWNHQVRYWSEPRHNKDWRSRVHAPHDLLGSMVLGTNTHTPSWRNIIKESDLPWTRDHVVQSNIVYPGAGFICMAIEAAAQSAPEQGRKPSGYSLRDVDIHHALLIPDDSTGVEVQIELRPCNESLLSAKDWKEFVIHSVSRDGEWTELCKGSISIEYRDDTTPEHWQDHTATADGARTTKLPQPPRPVDYRMRVMPQDIYANMRSVGIHHGPIFQNLTSVRARTAQAVSTFVTADTAAVMPLNYQRPHVIHPTTLDTVLQSAYCALSESRGKMTNPLVPRTIKSLWISHDIAKTPSHSFRSYSNLLRQDSQGADVDILVCDDKEVQADGNIEPVIKLAGLELRSLGVSSIQPAQSQDEKFARAEWVPSLDLAPLTFARQELGWPLPAGEAETIVDLRRLCYYYIQDALKGLVENEVGGLPWYFQKFHTWMVVQDDLAKTNKLAGNSADWESDGEEIRSAVAEKVKKASVNGEMVHRLGPLVLKMLRQEITPLELMLEDKLLHRYYVEALKWDRANRQMGALVKHFAQNNPRGKILEIGGGTGGTTRMNLASLGTDSSGWGPLAASYDFTDVSSGFFEEAQKKFADWKSLVRYKKLDVERDASKQGFELGTYDLIVASQVLHATKNMEHTMARVRSLLKPGGKLFIMETTQDQVDLQFAFGLLPGWWLSEEQERKLSPSLSIDMWDRVLKSTGFAGVELEVHDCEDEEFYSFSVMSSTALDTSAPSGTANATPAPEVLLVLGDEGALHQPNWTFVEHLRSAIAESTGEKPNVVALNSALSVSDKLVIYLGDADGSGLRAPSTASFDAVRRLCTDSKAMLWVTGTHSVDTALSAGLLRSAREEYAGKRLVTLHLDAGRSLWAAESVTTVANVFSRVLLRRQRDGAASEYQDFEYAERNGVVHVLRYFKDAEKNKAAAAAAVSSGEAQALVTTGAFCQPDRSLRLRVGTAGLLDTLAFEDDADADKELPADYLEITPRAFGVNFRDIMVAMGQLGHDSTMGFECAGTVARAGADAASRGGFVKGDRVMTLMHGNYANAVRVPWTNAVKIPDSLPYEVAASLPMVYTTAYVALFDTARLQKGERILIHAATGGVGQAACILAKFIGAEVFVTVGTQEKRDFVMATYGLAPDHIFSSRDTSFGRRVLSMTGGEGVDVVLNSLAGPLLQEGFNCLGRFGRFVELGKRDLKMNSRLGMAAFNRAVSFSHVDLLQLEAFKSAQVQRIMKEIMQLYCTGCIQAVQPIAVHPLAELEKTFRLLQAGKHMGKIILSVGAGDLVPVLPRTTTPKLDPDASYLIIGGLGGIGRSIGRWMAENGARNLIVLSRSASGTRAESFVMEMSEMACATKVMQCDITIEEDLAICLKQIRSSLPPVRGVVQAAMVLQDAILEQMTLADYEAAVKPKVHGSWNLHDAFDQQDSLDFFIMLSSLAGILGHASQSNYSAGGSYQDALAHRRTAAGLPGVAIDLGVVSSVGYVAEHDGTAERMTRSGHTILSEADVLNAVRLAVASPFSGQMLLGLNSGPGPHWEGTCMCRDMRFASLRDRERAKPGDEGGSTAAAAASDLAGCIVRASSLEEAANAVADAVVKKLMTIFMMQASEIQTSQRLSEFGVDSLVAVELRNMLALRAGSDVSIFDIMQSSSIAKLAAVVASKSTYLRVAE